MKKLKFLSISLLALLAGCSSSSDKMFDLGMHTSGTNYLSRDLDKQEIQIVKSDTDVNGFPDAVITVNKLSNSGGTTYVAGQGIPMAGALTLSPVKRAVLTSRFSDARTLNGETKPHNGIDLGVSEGTPVYASGSGKVVAVANNTPPFSGYGYIILIQHSDNVETLYAHLSAQNVSVGTQVTAGQEIGKSGSSGESVGAHLHFEVRIKDQPVVPGLPIYMQGFIAKDPTLYVTDLKGAAEKDTIEQGKGKVN